MALAKTLTQRIEQAAGISAATCANEGSPENNYNVIVDLKSTVYALTLELSRVAEYLRNGETIPPGVLAHYGELPEIYRAKSRGTQNDR